MIPGALDCWTFLTCHEIRQLTQKGSGDGIPSTNNHDHATLLGLEREKVLTGRFIFFFKFSTVFMHGFEPELKSNWIEPRVIDVMWPFLSWKDWDFSVGWCRTRSPRPTRPVWPRHCLKPWPLHWSPLRWLNCMKRCFPRKNSWRRTWNCQRWPWERSNMWEERGRLNCWGSIWQSSTCKVLNVPLRCLEFFSSP